MNKSKKKFIEGAPEWDSDKSTKDCVLCNKRFGTFKRRRHHCRQCGRVVCSSCSSKRLVLEGEAYLGQPQRVCDGCYDTLTQKKQALTLAYSRREREESLLAMTSAISDTLVRVFFLDGTFKTLSFDECTTASELASKICFAINVALFEVERDLRDPEQVGVCIMSS